MTMTQASDKTVGEENDTWGCPEHASLNAKVFELYLSKQYDNLVASVRGLYKRFTAEVGVTEALEGVNEAWRNSLGPCVDIGTLRSHKQYQDALRKWTEGRVRQYGLYEELVAATMEAARIKQLRDEVRASIDRGEVMSAALFRYIDEDAEKLLDNAVTHV